MAENMKLQAEFRPFDTSADRKIPCSVASSSDLRLTQTEHYHDYYQIYYITKGGLNHSVNGHIIHLVRGDCFIIPPYTIHSIKIDDPKSSFYSFSFYDSFLSADITRQRAIQSLFSNLTPDGIMGRLVLEPDEAVHMDELMHFAREEFDNTKPGFECVLSSLLTTILTILSRVYARKKYKFKYNNAILSVIEYIKEHYSEEITVKDITNRVFLSEATFFRIFKQTTGQSFKNYLTTVRIQKACKILREHNASITQAALSCGYGNYSSFFRAFSKQMLMSPIEYQKSYVICGAEEGVKSGGVE